MSTNALGSLVAMALLTSPWTVPKASTAAATIRLGAVRIPQIGDQLLDTPRCLEFGRGRCEHVVLDVHHQHGCTAFEQRGGDALAHALSGAGDDRGLAAHRIRVCVSHFAGPILSCTPRCIS